MTIRTLVATVALGALVTTPASAELGHWPCSGWLEARKIIDEMHVELNGVIVAWIDGYSTGAVGGYKTETQDIIDLVTAECFRSPNETIYEATRTVINRLIGQAARRHHR